MKIIKVTNFQRMNTIFKTLHKHISYSFSQSISSLHFPPYFLESNRISLIEWHYPSTPVPQYPLQVIFTTRMGNNSRNSRYNDSVDCRRVNCMRITAQSNIRGRCSNLRMRNATSCLYISEIANFCVCAGWMLILVVDWLDGVVRYGVSAFFRIVQ